MKRDAMREIERVLLTKLQQATQRLRADPECTELREIWDMAAQDVARHRARWTKRDAAA